MLNEFSVFSRYFSHMETAMRMSAPYILLTALLFMGMISVFYPLGSAVKAPFFLMGLYYWAIYRPKLLPPWLLFCAGCFVDFLSGFPLGLTGLVYLLIQFLVIGQRRFLMGQNFLIIWFCFFVLGLFGFLLQWFFFGLTQLSWPPLQPLIISALIGGSLFPTIHLFLHLTHKIIPPPALNRV